MIMNQEDIDERLRNSKVGEEVTLDVRWSDLHKGITLIRICRTIIFRAHTTLQFELEIDPHDASSYDDKYILFSTDAAQSYYQELTMKDDKVDGNHTITLEYDGIKKDLNYSLKLDLGGGNEPHFVFKDMPYSKLAD